MLAKHPLLILLKKKWRTSAKSTFETYFHVTKQALKTGSGVALIRTPSPSAEEKGALLLKGEEKRRPTVMKF
ncbi:hypothetical protein ILYODFUR_015088 [Ilyodon furcidens]